MFGEVRESEAGLVARDFQPVVELLAQRRVERAVDEVVGGGHAARLARCATARRLRVAAAGRDLRLLLVEDEREALEMARLMLEERGAEVSAATSAAEGFRLLRELRPDVLISDIEMPGEDGYALVGRVRSLAPVEGGDTHCVALTAHARPEDRLRALAASFDAHVAKPVEVAELAAVLAALARRRKA
jgi:CheY-like chemotaxis protein